MIGSPDLYRAWKDVGTRGLDEVERYARLEFRDGSLAWMQRPAAPLEAREPTLLRRLAAAMHLRPARAGIPAPSAVGPLHPGTAAVHFAEEPKRRTDPCAHAAASTVLLVPAREGRTTHDVACHES